MIFSPGERVKVHNEDSVADGLEGTVRAVVVVVYVDVDGYEGPIAYAPSELGPPD